MEGYGGPAQLSPTIAQCLRPPRNESIKIIRRLGSAAILQAILATTKLAALRRIDAP
jgi:hypothetical protein